MLTEIRLKNFKCFQNEIIIPTGLVNLLTGINGRGKSTALQSLLCMRQSHEKSRTTDRLFFNGNCVDLGNFKDVKNSLTSISEEIELCFEYELGDDFFIIRYFFQEDEKDDLAARIKEVKVEGELDKKPFAFSLQNKGKKVFIEEKNLETFFHDLFIDYESLTDVHLNFVGRSLNFRRIHYVSADRMGPREYYVRESFADFPNVGAEGQFTVDILARFKNEPVQQHLCLKKGASETVLDQASAWLDHIFSGGKIDIESYDARIISARMNADGSTHLYKPTNLGFGYSYLLPVIVSGLIAEEGDVLIVENPEAHLHPMAQCHVATFLALVSQGGVQVFIESHSEHVLNGVRVAVLEKQIECEHVNILYFLGEKKYSVLKIPLSDEGKIQNWPDGFFDQAEKEFLKLHGV